MDHSPAADRPPSGRVVVRRHRVDAAGISLAVATENVAAPTDWSFSHPEHTIVVHLAGRLRRMESVFSRGPSSRLLPSVGDVWVIPAGCRYAALAQGDQVRFAEFQLPADLRGSSTPAGRVGHRDAFLHQASVRAASLVERDDDLARMALQALLETLRLHLTDALLGAPASAPKPADLRRFSQRQRERLVDFIEASLHGDIAVADLAAAGGMPSSCFVQSFKASFGTTPWQYVLRARLAVAQRLLEASDESITAIASRIGFASPSHFATAFGKHFGQSPASFRRARRDGRFLSP